MKNSMISQWLISENWIYLEAILLLDLFQIQTTILLLQQKLQNVLIREAWKLTWQVSFYRSLYSKVNYLCSIPHRWKNNSQWWAHRREQIRRGRICISHSIIYRYTVYVNYSTSICSTISLLIFYLDNVSSRDITYCGTIVIGTSFHWIVKTSKTLEWIDSENTAANHALKYYENKRCLF